jgi:hypothetical protein
MCNEPTTVPADILDAYAAIVIPTKCLPFLGIHERCDHDPATPPPTFAQLTRPT